MNGKEFARLVERDHACLHCGETEAIAPNHRANRGMGGKNSRAERPSNLVVICSILNGQIEADHRWAQMAKDYGWKLESWEDPLTVPVMNFNIGKWVLLDDEYGTKVVMQEERETIAEHNTRDLPRQT